MKFEVEINLITNFQLSNGMSVSLCNMYVCVIVCVCVCVIVCVIVYSFIYSSERIVPNKLKFLEMIPLGVQMVLGLKTSGFD